MKLQPGLGDQSRRAWRRAGAVQLACAGGLLLVVVATVGWAYQATDSQGLNGILPRQVPAGLTDEDWNVLGPNWEQWAQETADLVYDLYEPERPDVAAQRATLDRLRVKLGTIEKALDDPKYRVIHPQLTGLHSRLSRRVDLASAILDMIDPEAARAGHVQSAYARLATAVDDLERDLRGVPNGSAWLPYVRAEQLKQAAASQDTSAETIERLSRVQQKIENRGSLEDAAQREFLGRASFAALSQAIGEVLAAQSWQPSADQIAAIRKQAARLVSAIEVDGDNDLVAYERDGSAAAAAEMNAAYRELKALAADGGARISDVMRRHYFAHNMRLVASEGFLRRAISESRQESSYINEPVSEAWVSGISCTFTDVSVDLQPNNRVAQFNLLVRGTVNATTTAVASRAIVYGGSTGNFTAVKPVRFDGKNFTTDPAMISANASTYTTDVDARVFFLLRIVADHIAEREVARRKPQTDAQLRQRIVNQVSQEVNTETNQRFSDATLELETKLYGPLRELEWHPDTIQTYSTDSLLVVRARVMKPNEAAGQVLAREPAVPSDGIAIQVHESLLNNGVERMEIAGKTMTDAELRSLMEERISKLLGREFKFSKPEESPPAPNAEGAEEAGDTSNNIYLFDEHDPIRFRVDNGSVTIILRTGLRRPDQEDIDPHIIEVPLAFSVDGDQIVMERQGNVRVVPAPGTPSSIARQNIMRQNIQQSIPSRTFKGTFDVEQQGKKITLHITQVDAQDGWVTVLAR